MSSILSTLVWLVFEQVGLVWLVWFGTFKRIFTTQKDNKRFLQRKPPLHIDTYCGSTSFRQRLWYMRSLVMTIPRGLELGVSKNRGFYPPKSSVLIGFSIIFTIHFGVPLFLETPNCFFSLLVHQL